MPQVRSAPVGDGFAIGLSGLCLAHCLALPIAASLLPAIGAWAQAEWVHWLFALVAAPVSLWTLVRPSTRSPAVIGLALLGLSLLFAGAAEFPSHDLETPITVFGSLLLAVAHGLNWRRRQPPCEDHKAA
jgi:hypothetical protein